MKKRVVTFGEILLRLSPNGYYRFTQADSYEVTYGGAEANVAISLANFGVDCKYVTVIPENDIGKAAINSLRKHGIDTSLILRDGKRLGIYFLEKGASQRPSKVIYDREYSAISTIKREQFDWDVIFDGVNWFHFTGITPALGDNIAEICIDACKAAKEKGITISCDLNYRKKLWTKDKAKSIMSKICNYVDVCIANEEDAEDVFGIKSGNSNILSGKLNEEGYKEVAKKLAEKFNFSKVAITLRSSISANDNNWKAMLYENDNFFFSRSYNIHIVDRVGAGDSFGAALIYSLLNGYSPQYSIDFATAASCLKHTIEGDFNQTTVEEVENLVNGDTSGRVQR